MLDYEYFGKRLLCLTLKLKFMKKCFVFAAILAVSALVLFGCNKSSSIETLPQAEKTEVSKILSLLEQEGITTAEEGSEFFAEVLGADSFITKGEAGYSFEDQCRENVSLEAAKIISNFQNVVVLEDDTEESVKNRFYSILDEGDLDKQSDEYVNIKLAIDSSFELLEYFVEYQAETKSFWEAVARVAKCIAGTVGSAGLGALAGAGAGTVTLPIIGTVSGSAVGAVCGGLVGMATFC